MKARLARGPITACEWRPSARFIRHRTIGSRYSSGVEVSDTVARKGKSDTTDQLRRLRDPRSRRIAKVAARETKVDRLMIVRDRRPYRSGIDLISALVGSSHNPIHARAQMVPELHS